MDYSKMTAKELYVSHLKWQKEHKEATRLEDIEMREDGMTHRINWWNHITGGDDESNSIYLCSTDFDRDWELLEKHGITAICKSLKANGLSIDYWNTLQKIKRESLGRDFKAIDLKEET